MEHLDTVVTKLQLQLLILTGLATLIYWLGLSFNEAFKARLNSEHFRNILKGELLL